MRGGHQLDPALRDGAGRPRLRGRPDLVDDHHFRHVVLHRLHHHPVLGGPVRDHEAAGPAQGRVGHVAVARHLVGGVHDDDATAAAPGVEGGAAPTTTTTPTAALLIRVGRQEPGQLPDGGRLAHARLAQQQDGRPAQGQVGRGGGGAGHRPPHAGREPDNPPRPGAQG